MNASLHLRTDVAIEPLIDRWYAWPSLLAPATGALYKAHAHLKIMQSFVATPQVHVAAAQNPAMLGGPFIHHPASRAPEVRALLEYVQRERAVQLRLAEAIKELDTLVATEGTGGPLETLYPRVPEALRGYVELVYDLSQRPAFRFFEGLMFESEYRCREAQSLRMVRYEGDARPFAFSTPRLSDPGTVELKLPFDSLALDVLYRARNEAMDPEALAETLSVPAESRDTWRSFFTDMPPAARPRFDEDGVRVRYFGHACVLFQTRDVSVLVDPLLTHVGAGRDDRYTYNDLPDTIDYLVITHNHQDHCLVETLLELRHRVRTVLVPRNASGNLSDPSLRLILRELGYRDVRELSDMDSVEIPGGEIVSLPFLGEHADLDVRTKQGVWLRLQGRSFMLLADSNNIEPKLYDHLARRIGTVDMLFIGMECEGAPMSWLYGPLLSKPVSRKIDQSRRLDGSDAAKAIGIVERFAPKQVWVYAMAQEPWLGFVAVTNYNDQSKAIVESNRLVQYCRDKGTESERLSGRRDMYLR